MTDRLCDDYFEWLCEVVGNSQDYRKLLTRLHLTEFRYILPMDQNCAEHGVHLRYVFADRMSEYIEGPCSVLEMMVALAMNCEGDIMDDPLVGNRTGQWFWGMITNLELGGMYDSNFDRDYTDMVINRFLDRKYKPNGKGGLFRIRGCDRDLRKVEIFHQLCWYLDTIT